jgi:hypothetical protein
MKLFRRQIAKGAAVLLVFVSSAMLLSWARWVQGIADGDRALAAGNLSGAEQAFEAADRWAAHTLLPAVCTRSQYRWLALSRASLLNSRGKYDDLEHVLEGAVARSPEFGADAGYHFWVGIVEYRKAMAQTDKRTQRAGLQQAADSFRAAMAAQPRTPGGPDWDAKYDYEFTSRLVAEMGNKKDQAPEKMNRGGMKILREDPDHPKEQQQKLAPNKQS